MKIVYLDAKRVYHDELQQMVRGQYFIERYALRANGLAGEGS